MEVGFWFFVFIFLVKFNLGIREVLGIFFIFSIILGFMSIKSYLLGSFIFFVE